MLSLLVTSVWSAHEPPSSTIFWSAACMSLLIPAPGKGGVAGWFRDPATCCVRRVAFLVDLLVRVLLLMVRDTAAVESCACCAMQLTTAAWLGPRWCSGGG